MGGKIFSMFDVVVVGAGASGVFAAIEAKRRSPKKRVAIFEKTNTCLSKVRVSGGGRCNVTHECFDIKALCECYVYGAWHDECSRVFY